MNPNDFEQQNDRTNAFKMEKKERRNDSIAWIIVSLLLVFLNVISIGRITVVGQFIDDVIFTFTFGWFKYMMYLIFIGLNICVYFGIRFKFKKRFLLMVLAVWCAIAWIISAILYICAYHLDIKTLTVDNYFSKSIFVDSIRSYITNWKRYSVFGDFKPNSWILSNSHTYFSLWAGGGFVGAFFSAIFSYTTIYGNLVFSLFGLFIVSVWIMTGDPLYLFKPKNKRKGYGLRILSLGSVKRVKKEKVGKPKKQRKGMLQIDYFDNNVTDYEIQSTQTFADITIEMPGFKRETVLRENEIHDIMGGPNGIDSFSDPFLEDLAPRPTQIDYDIYNDDQNLYQNPNNLMNTNQQPVHPNYEYQDFGQQQAPFINQQTKQQEQFNNYEPQFDETDFPKGKYGDLPVEKAREEFKRETSITPFGANGKTMELLGKMREPIVEEQPIINEVPLTEVATPKKAVKKNDFVSDGQITLDEFMENTDNHVVNAQVPDYDSPLKRRLPKNNMDFDWTATQNVGTSTATPKKTFDRPKMEINRQYQLPPQTLLDQEKTDPALLAKLKSEAEEKAKIINNVFDSFNAKARVSNFLIGPSITQFVVTLDSGSKVQSIMTLENELKLRLATQNVLMQSPINGMAAVGIEVPNSTTVPVQFKSIVGRVPLQNANAKLLFPIGKDVVGEVIFGEMTSMPHLLVAGSTGSGKSVMINSIITSILMRARPHEVKMLLIDPKRVELLPYANIPHLLSPIISNMALAAGALKKVVFEMEHRYNLFSQNGVKNILGYNDKVKKEEEKLPYIVVIIDELADLMLTENKKAVEEAIMRLTQMARAAGIHLIVATQRPSTDVITGVIKANIPTRISFAVANQYDSRTILDTNGAEKLIGRGDMLFMKPGTQKPIRAQGIYVADEEIQRIAEFCAKQQEPQFDQSYLEEESVAGGVGGHDDELDPMYEEAIKLIAASGQASTSYLQRKLRIGYNRASRIIDQLEENGLIGPQNGAKSRDIFINNN